MDTWRMDIKSSDLQKITPIQSTGLTFGVLPYSEMVKLVDPAGKVQKMGTRSSAITFTMITGVMSDPRTS